MTRRGRKPLPADRLWGRCRRDRQTGCLLYLDGHLVDGYGVLSVDGRPTRAHRLAWRLVRGRISAGRMVTHRCDTRHCCEVTHLRLGDHASNARDAVARGRTNAGERNGNAVLTIQAVQRIRRDYRRGHVGSLGYSALATEFGVNRETIARIVRRERWRAA